MYSFKSLYFYLFSILFIVNPVFANDSLSEAIAYPTKGFIPLNVTLDASLVSGDIVDYQWTATPQEESSNKKIVLGERVTLLLTEPDTYNLTLIVTDKNGKNSTKEIAIINADKNPKACFELSKTKGNIAKNQPFVITADASCSTGERLKNFKWDVDGIPTDVGREATFSFTEASSHTITLKVINAKNKEDTTRQKITVGKLEAKIKTIPNKATLKDIITLDATRSDGGIYPASELAYKWNAEVSDEPKCQNINTWFDDNISSNTAMSFNGSVNRGVECPITVFLTITDPDNVTTNTKKIEPDITISLPVIPPLAKIISVSPTYGTAPLKLELDGSGSSDKDGDIIQYTWMAAHENGIFAFEKSSYEATTTINIEQSGNYTINLFVTDNDGWRNEIPEVFEQLITIPDVIPTAGNPKISKSEDGTPLLVILDGSYAVDQDGIIKEYIWKITNNNGYDDEISAIEPKIKHQFQKGGTYLFTLFVIDNSGLQSDPSLHIPFSIDSTLKIEPQSHVFTVPDIKTSKPKPISIEKIPDIEGKSLTNMRRRTPINETEYWPGKVIVRFYENISIERRKYLAEIFNAELINILSSINAEVWKVEDVEETIELQHNFPEIKKISPDYIIRAKDIDTINKNLLSQQRVVRSGKDNLIEIKTKKTVLCAVLDSGIDYTHEALKDYIWENLAEKNGKEGFDDDGNGKIDDIYGYDFVNDDGDPMDDCNNSHGTHVAGIIAGINNKENKENVNVILTGMTKWPAKIMALKILTPTLTPFGTEECLGSFSNAIAALEYVQINASTMDIKCTNNSWGGSYEFNQDLADSIKIEEDAGRLFITASGNEFREDNDLRPHYPASYEFNNIITVCSVGRNNKLSGFSNFGKNSVDLCALGERVKSTIIGNRFNIHNGTSMATPYVTAAVTVLWSAYPHLAMSEVKSYILNSTDSILELKDNIKTGGRLNLYKAITQIQSQRKIFTVSNNGDSDLYINEVDIIGKNPDLFQITQNKCLSNQLKPDETCKVEVEFMSNLNEDTRLQAELKISSTGIVSQTISAVLSTREDENKITSLGLSDSMILKAENVVINPSEPNLQESEAMVVVPPKTNLEKPIIYTLDEMLDIPTVVALNEGKDTNENYWAKLSLINKNPLTFKLDDYGNPHTPERKLGTPSYDISNGTLNIPFIKLGNSFYEIDMKIIVVPEGDYGFEIKEFIPIH